MRLAVVALSTVLLSGCSWMGSGGGYGYGDSYSYGQGGAYGCAPMGGNAQFGNSGYGFAGGGAGCAGGAGYNVAYGGAGAGMYGAGAGGGIYGAGAGLRGAYGVNGYGTGLSGAGAGLYGAGSGLYGAGAGVGGAGGGLYGAGAGVYGAGSGLYGAGTGVGGGLGGVGGALGTGLAGVGTGLGGLGSGVSTLGGVGGAYPGFGGVTTLNAASPFGAAVGGLQTLPGGGTVQTIQGAPIYVPQPYPAYYSAGSVGGFNTGGFGGALPFGLELGGGQDFNIDGDFFPGEKGKTDPVSLLTVSELAPIGYDDAFDNSTGLDLTATYDVSQSTTLLARAGYSKADGNLLNIGTVSDGVVTEDLFAEFSDLEQYTIEGGFRKYMGYPAGVRPYIGATAGFTKYDDVSLTQSSATLVDPSVFTQTYADGGWAPTASGIVGAEWALGPRSGIGIETGVRWTEALDTNFTSDDKISVPVRLRGRLSF